MCEIILSKSMRVEFKYWFKGLGYLAITSGSIYISGTKLILFQSVLANEKDRDNHSSKRFLDLRKQRIDNESLKNALNTIKADPSIGHVMWNKDHVGKPEYDELKTKIEEKIIENNKKFRRYPNDFILGVLSLHSYEDSKRDEKIIFLNKELNNEYERFVSGWLVHDVVKEEGYYGVIYKNEKNKQIVLAHRGTTFEFKDLFNTNTPLNADINGVVKNQIIPDQKLVNDLTKKAIVFAKENGYFLSITGHSLGAWLAEMSNLYANQSFKYNKARTVTFESPGSKPSFDKFKSNVENKWTEYDARNFDMTSYLSTPNFINCCNGHYGNLIECEFDKDELEKNLPDNIKCLNPVFLLYGILALRRHFLESILKKFDKNSGKPLKYKVVTDWPILVKASESQEVNEAMTIANILNLTRDTLKSGQIDKSEYKKYFMLIANSKDPESIEFELKNQAH